MVLIFSHPLETTTNHVITWLNHFKIKWVRINEINNLEHNNLTVEIQKKKFSFFLIKNGNKYDLKEFGCLWFRKTPENKYDSFERPFDLYFTRKALYNMHKEWDSILDYFTLAVQDLPTINDPSATRNINKIHQLQVASRFGIDIPNTIVCSDKKSLDNFIKANKKIVIKPIHNIVTHKFNNKEYSSYTNIFNKNIGKQLKKNFHPAFLQEKVEKEFEIRSFYFFGKFYSMAIFSQNDRQTSIDFRRYNYDNPNRNVPYKLPKKVEAKLSRFMQTLNLNSGSLDLIKSTSGKFIFLEVNPVGQFGMVSIPCNYYIEKEIALKLKKFNNEKKVKKVSQQEDTIRYFNKAASIL